MDTGMIAILINAVITVLVVLGVSLVGFKKVMKAIDESADVPKLIKKALDDDKLTKEEVDEILEAINEASGAWNDVFARRTS